MTNEQFSREYHLLDRLSQGAVVTHHAQSATGAMVMVHFLRASSEENAAVVRELDALPAERRSRILTVVDVDGVTAIVTKFMLDFTSFQDWLASGVTAAPREVDAAIARDVNAAPPPAEPGEFTQFFKGVAGGVPPQQPAGSPPIDASAPSSPAATPGEPGEFTLFFRGSPTAGGPQPKAPIEPAQPAPSRLSLAQRPGEFTQMFGAPMSVGDQPKSSGAEAMPNDDPRSAEFGQRPVPSTGSLEGLPPAAPAPFPQFESPSQPLDRLSVQPSWTVAPSSQPPMAPPGPGDYTRIFGGPSAPPPAAPVPTRLPPSSPPPSLDWGSADLPIASGAGDSYFERLADGPPPPPNFPPASPRNVPAAPPAFSGPSEFTRIISGPPPFAPPTPPAPRPLAPPPPVTPIGNSSKARDRVLLFSLVGTVLLAVILVVVFVVAT